VREDLESLAAREGVTVFLTTHNMAEAERLCSEVAVIRQGKLVAIGNPDKLRARAGGPRVEIVGRGFSDHALQLLRARPEVAAAVVENRHLEIDLREETDVAPFSEGVQVQEVRHGKASLEEVFVTLMQEER
jgi:ABC-2 type transport system ATP-binding protein